jgi:hypothetical protein
MIYTSLPTRATNENDDDFHKTVTLSYYHSTFVLVSPCALQYDWLTKQDLINNKTGKTTKDKLMAQKTVSPVAGIGTQVSFGYVEGYTGIWCTAG